MVEDLIEEVLEKACVAITWEEEEALAKLQPLEAADGDLPCAGCAEPQHLEEGEKQAPEEKAQNVDEGGASALGPAGTAAAEMPVQLEGESDPLPEGAEGAGAVVGAVPGTPEAEEQTPALHSSEQAWAPGVPSEAPAPGEAGEPGRPSLLSPEVPAAELPVQKESQASALPPETTGSEAAAAAGQSVTEGACVQMTAKGAGPILEPNSLERTTAAVLPQSEESAGGKMQGAILHTETASRRGNSEGSQMEEAVLSGHCPGPVPAAPTTA
ncbi:cuticle collagen 1-like [Struthio camelus]|uniref:cuticle collagen 1-like n=1 Tax=Struthio camelus TaxID=8801 RepID=UPI003603C396